MAASAILSQGPPVAATLLQICEAQNDEECVAVLRSAVASVVFSMWAEWDNSVAVHDLMLAIPPAVFARLEKRLDKIEGRIRAKLGRLPVGDDTNKLGSVTVCPRLLAGPGAGEGVAPSGVDASRIWGSGRVRLFISHVSSYRSAASKIKAGLLPMGITAFIAHEDVEPTLEWQKEIEIALQSMDVLCALSRLA